MDELTAKKVTPAISSSDIKSRKIYKADGKDRELLLLAWALGVLIAGLLGCRTIPGLGITVLTVVWYGVLFWYKGSTGLRNRANFLLLIAITLLALTFSLYSNLWLRGWNLLFLMLLITVQMFQWSGQGSYSWNSPIMLAERFCLLLSGVFCKLPASWDTGKSYRGDRRVLTILAGLGLTVPVLLIALILLTQADSYFAIVTGDVIRFLVCWFGSGVVRVVLGLLMMPFLFGLFYTVRYPEKTERKTIARPNLDPLLPGVMLLVMDLLYIFFLAVQFTALFGGAAYLERVSGLSYAEYARSGFFQLVFVAILNLTLSLFAIQCSKKEGGSWTMLQVLATVLIVMSGVILISAAYRMSLYVSVYGMSFKRVLTYWGMVMLGLFFAVAILKVWKKDFCCFPILFSIAVAGWLLLNYCNVDRIVAQYNVDLYRQDRTAMIDLDYLAYGLSYDGLQVLTELPENSIVVSSGRQLKAVLKDRREWAAGSAADWRTWSLSAALAAR